MNIVCCIICCCWCCMNASLGKLQQKTTLDSVINIYHVVSLIIWSDQPQLFSFLCIIIWLFIKKHMVYLYFHTEKVDLHKIEYSNSLENQLFKALPIKRGGESLVVRNTWLTPFCFICQIDDETVIYTFRFLLVTILSCPPHFEI